MNLNEGKKFYESRKRDDDKPWHELPPRIQRRYAEVAQLLPIDTQEKAVKLAEFIQEELQHINELFSNMMAKRNGEEEQN